jgi:D-3-phosphoglycerate dehydrogenase
MKVTIIDDWFDTLRGLPCFEKLNGHDVTIWTDHVEETEALVERLHDTECLVLFRERTRITGELLDRLPKLKLISQRSVYPHIDVEACTRNGVTLCSNMHADTPSYATAEHTWGLILAAMRQIPQQMASAKAGTWQSGVGKNLRGRTIGLYGYGRIARTVAGYADAFGMNVVWWSSESGRARALADGQRVADSREAFFAASDIVSVHVRLKPSTKGVITRDDLRVMGREALFVNTSRSRLVENGALLSALNEGRPGMAAVDVFDVEPLLDPNDPLLAHPRLIATPHIGYVTEDEYNIAFSDIFDQVVAYQEGNPIHVINTPHST